MKKTWPKGRLSPGVRLGLSMLGNICYKRRFMESTELLFENGEKSTKTWGFCSGVRLGQSLLGTDSLKEDRRSWKKNI